MKLILSVILFVFYSTVAQAVTVCQSSACGRIVCNYGCVQRSVNGVCVVNKCVGGKSTNILQNSESSMDGIEEPGASAPETTGDLTFSNSKVFNSYHCAAGRRCAISGIVNGHVIADANSMVVITGIVNGNLYCRSCQYRISGILNGSVIQR